MLLQSIFTAFCGLACFQILVAICKHICADILAQASCSASCSSATFKQLGTMEIAVGVDVAVVAGVVGVVGGVVGVLVGMVLAEFIGRNKKAKKTVQQSLKQKQDAEMHSGALGAHGAATPGAPGAAEMYYVAETGELVHWRRNCRGFNAARRVRELKGCPYCRPA